MSSLKESTAHAVERAGGPVIAAKLLGVSTQEISLWCIEGNTRFIPIDHLVDLDAWAGDLFLKTWAADRGYDLVSREAKPTPAENVLHTIGQFAKAGGALECTTIEAASDHHFSRNEAREIQNQIRPVKDSIEQLERAIAQNGAA